MKKITNVLILISVLSLNSFYAFATDPTIEPLQQNEASSNNYGMWIIGIIFVIFILSKKSSAKSEIINEMSKTGKKNLYG